MNFPLLYPWIKALHVAAAFIFVAGVLLEAVAFWVISKNPTGSTSFIPLILAWGRMVTTPAMLATLVVWYCTGHHRSMGDCPLADCENSSGHHSFRYSWRSIRSALPPKSGREVAPFAHRTAGVDIRRRNCDSGHRQARGGKPRR